ncbi:MAG: DUF72 domain-containing protein [Bacteroidota bacterium]
MESYIGCSGFYYPEWKGKFYPQKLASTKWLAYYAGHFSAIEINNTFYRMPNPETLKKSAERTPEDFRFALKVPKLISHFKQMQDVNADLAQFYVAAEQGLGNKMLCALFQFPPSFHYSPEALDAVLAPLSSSFNNVVEFRHESWWNADVFEQFAKKGICFCSPDIKKIPRGVVNTSGMIYLRLHGQPRTYFSAYSDEELVQFEKDIIALNPAKACIMFNNTALGFAPENALFMKALFGQETGENKNAA